jgi:hypothetical protein
MQGNEPLAKILLSHPNTKINILNANKLTPLGLAKALQLSKFVELILNSGKSFD